MPTLTLSGVMNWFVYKKSLEIQSHYITLSFWLAINISGSLKVNKFMTLHWFQLTAYPQKGPASQASCFWLGMVTSGGIFGWIIESFHPMWVLTVDVLTR